MERQGIKCRSTSAYWTEMTAGHRRGKEIPVRGSCHADGTWTPSPPRNWEDTSWRQKKKRSTKEDLAINIQRRLTVRSLENACHTWALRGAFTTRRYINPRLPFFTFTFTGKRSRLEQKRDNGGRPCALAKPAAHCSTRDGGSKC